mgnify:CR=1 FL=1
MIGELRNKACPPTTKYNSTFHNIYYHTSYVNSCELPSHYKYLVISCLAASFFLASLHTQHHTF